MKEENCSVYYSCLREEKTKHHHNDHQILLIRKGELKLFVNGREMMARSGDAVLFSRFENHSLRVCSEEYERYVLRISPTRSLLSSRLSALLTNRPEGFSNVIPTGEKEEALTALFSALLSEEKEKGRFYRESVSLLTDRILILLCRLLPHGLFAPEEEGFEMVWELQKRFEAEPGSSYRLADLAAEYHVSPSGLSHRFKGITGVSVMEYLMDCRIAFAKDRLLSTRLSVGSIAEASGFGDASNFSRYFKEKNGMSPSLFRAKAKAR